MEAPSQWAANRNGGGFVSRRLLVLFGTVAVLAFGPSAASAAVFDFEEQPVTAASSCNSEGGLTTLVEVDSGLTATVTRAGGALIHVRDLGPSAPFGWGSRTICPTPGGSGTESPFIVNFSQPVDTARIDAGEFSNEPIHTATLNAYSGPNGTGTLLDTDSAVVPDDFGFVSTSVTVFGSQISSITFIGTSDDSATNLLFWDNLVASADTEPPTGTCSNTPATVSGTVGTPGDDVIVGTSGNDVITGGGGNDLICAGEGNDRVLGGEGNDRIFGGEGNDNLNGEAGNDKVYGEAGNDQVYGASGDDKVFGNDGR